MLGRVWPEGACRPSPAFPSCRHVRRHRSGCRRDPAVYEQHGEFSGGLLLQALAIGSFLPARSLGEFYAVASVFGLAYGGVMPLYAVLARDYFGPRIMGTVFGAATMASCLGMAAGPAVGGWVFDRFGSYAGMHLSSLAIGLGAVAIAFTFPPLPRMRPERLKPA